MRIFARADGGILTTIPAVGPGDGAVSVPLPMVSQIARTLDFDTETNQVLVDDIQLDVHGDRSGRYAVTAAGLLTKDGALVTIAAPGQFTQDRSQVQAALGQLDALIDAANAGNLTAAQSQQALRLLLRAARFILRWIIRRG